MLHDLIFKLSDAKGVSGITDALLAAEDTLVSAGIPKKLIVRDSMGGLSCTVKGQSNYHIVIDAHIDEVGMIVTSVDDKGFVRTDKCGSTDIRALPSAEVVIFGKETVTGVFCAPVPHLNKNAGSLPEITEMAIDTGLKNAKDILSPGDRVAFTQTAADLLNGKITGKSLDDRAGAAAVMSACIKIFQGGMPKTTVTLLLSAQEEVGLRGAQASAFSLSPDEAISVDVTFGGTYDSPAHKLGRLSKGPMIGVSPVLDHEISEALKRLAIESNIPYQIEVMGGKTSTNADAVSVSRAGVKCGLLSIPLRYMHTQVEVIDIKDAENTALLLYHYVMKGGHRNA